MREPSAGVDYPTDSQLKAALKLLLDYIPEEIHDDVTYEASELLYTFIEYYAQPDPDDEDEDDEDVLPAAEYWRRDGDVITSVDDRWEITFTGSAQDGYPYSLREKADGEWRSLGPYLSAQSAQLFAERTESRGIPEGT